LRPVATLETADSAINVDGAAAFHRLFLIPQPDAMA